MATELTLSAQTAFAQVVDAARSIGLSRSVADLNGSFGERTISGRRYWYFQFRGLDGTGRSLYVGPDSPALRALIDRSRRPSAIPAIKALARAAIDLGCAGVPGRHYRVIARLAEFGFFRAGGVLIGTHAFLAFANMLGVRWASADRTQDVDFAHAGRNLAIALPANIEIDTHRAIESLEQGFIPYVGLSGKAGASYRHPTEAGFQLDFLTTLHRGGDAPYAHKQLGVVLQPLRFLEYLLEEVAESAIVSEGGAVLVSLPVPARYAIHKLIVTGERFGGASNPKSGKDLQQARELLGLLREVRPDRVEEAWSAAIARGPGWAKRARAGLAALERLAPALGARAWLDGAARRSDARPRKKEEIPAAGKGAKRSAGKRTGRPSRTR